MCGTGMARYLSRIEAVTCTVDKGLRLVVDDQKPVQLMIAVVAQRQRLVAGRHRGGIIPQGAQHHADHVQAADLPRNIAQAPGKRTRPLERYERLGDLAILPIRNANLVANLVLAELVAGST